MDAPRKTAVFSCARRMRWRAAWFVELCCVCTLIAPSAVARADANDRWRERIESMLAAAGPAAKATPELRAKELAGLGVPAVPALLDALADTFVLASEGASPRRTAKQSEADREALFGALAEMPFFRVREALESKLAGASRTELRRAALLLLTSNGTARDLPLLLRIAPRADAGDPAADALEKSFELALRELLVRDKDGFTVLETAFSTLEPALQRSVIRAIGATGSGQGLKAFARLLDRGGELAIVILNAIGTMSTRVAFPIDEHVLATVRHIVLAKDQNLLAEATLVAGKLDDYESIPHLIALLDDPNRGVRSNALWALQHMTGLKLREKSNRWQVWYRQESTWWRDDSARTFERLRSKQTLEVRSALAEMIRQHTQQHRLAEIALDTLDSQDVTVVTMACYAFSVWRSPVACPALVGCLSHADASVRQSAWKALKAITGRDLAQDPELWRHSLALP